MSKALRFLVLLSLVCSVLVLSPSPTVAQEGGTFRVTMGAAGTEVIFDVALATDTTSHTFIEMMYPALAPRNEITSIPEHGTAEEWTISEDALTYTFTIKQGVPWVVYDVENDEVAQVTDENGDVRYVTAHDFVYGALRTMDPATASDYGYLPADWTAGGQAFNSGDGSAEDVGIEALDDYTLQITAPEPAGFLLQVYGLWVFTAQPQWAIEEYGDAWTLPGNYPSYGTYVLKEYDPGSRVLIVKNSFWEGTESHPVASFDEIEARFLDESAALAAYEAGEVDATEGVPLPDLDRLRVERPDELIIGPRDCTYVYGFNVEKAPFDNVHARRAFSAAIDRQTLVDFILKAGQEPAGFFSRPNFPASATQEEYPDLGAHSDPALAVEELNLYFEETGLTRETMPAITLMHNTSEAHALIAQAIQQMWKETLDIEVTIANQEWQTYLDLLDEDAPQVFRYGWCADYPDPHNFLSDVYYSTSGNNDTNWANEEYDAILDEAKLLIDFEERVPMYARAEHILTWEDAAIAPIYFYTALFLVSPDVNFTASTIGVQRYDKWSFK